VHLVGLIIRIYHDARSPDANIELSEWNGAWIDLESISTLSSACDTGQTEIFVQMFLRNFTEIA